MAHGPLVSLILFSLRVMEIQLHYFKTLCPHYVLFDFIRFLRTCVKMDTPKIKKRTLENGPHTIAKMGAEGELFLNKKCLLLNLKVYWPQLSTKLTGQQRIFI